MVSAIIPMLLLFYCEEKGQVGECNGKNERKLE
jgi:hypothetical protein